MITANELREIISGEQAVSAYRWKIRDWIKTDTFQGGLISLARAAPNGYVPLQDIGRPDTSRERHLYDYDTICRRNLYDALFLDPWENVNRLAVWKDELGKLGYLIYQLYECKDPTSLQSVVIDFSPESDVKRKIYQGVS